MNELGLTLGFDALRKGLLGISAAYGSFLAEVASHCLRRHDHANPVLLCVTGDVCAAGSLRWCDVNEPD